MRRRFLMPFSVSVIALSACANRPAPPPAISYDTESFKPAVAQVEPEPTPPDVGGDIPAPAPQIAPPVSAKPDTRPPL